MKKTFLTIFILLTPFFILISINEYSRFILPKSSYSLKGLPTINSNKKLIHQCTWACHNNTTKHCKTNHIRLQKIYVKKIDIFYFGIIRSLRGTGDYRLANIVFLVILIPLTMYILLIKSINIQQKISQLKKWKS